MPHVEGAAESLVYGPIVIDHATSPRNVGVLEAPDGIGVAGDPLIGNQVRIALRVREAAIEAARFRAFGCSATIAAASITTELVTGLRLDRAGTVDARQIEAALGGLPAEKQHCARVAASALQQALAAAGRGVSGAQGDGC